MQLVADIEARFRVPTGGGRPTDPRWSERRLVPFAPRTLRQLEKLSARVRERGGVNIEPMQLAALLLERTTERLSETEAEDLVRPRRHASRLAAMTTTTQPECTPPRGGRRSTGSSGRRKQ